MANDEMRISLGVAGRASLGRRGGSGCATRRLDATAALGPAGGRLLVRVRTDHRPRLHLSRPEQVEYDAAPNIQRAQEQKVQTPFSTRLLENYEHSPVNSERATGLDERARSSSCHSRREPRCQAAPSTPANSLLGRRRRSAYESFHRLPRPTAGPQNSG